MRDRDKNVDSDQVDVSLGSDQRLHCVHLRQTFKKLLKHRAFSEGDLKTLVLREAGENSPVLRIFNENKTCFRVVATKSGLLPLMSSGMLMSHFFDINSCGVVYFSYFYLFSFVQ